MTGALFNSVYGRYIVLIRQPALTVGLLTRWEDESRTGIARSPSVIAGRRATISKPTEEDERTA